MTDGRANRRRRSAQPSASAGLLRSPRFGRWLFAGVTALAVLYLAIGLRRTWIASIMYGPGYLGMSRAETRYIYGPPTVGRDRDAEWRYLDEGAASVFRFDANGTVTQLGCGARVEGGGAGCPDVLGVGIGTGEEQIWSAFGTPPVQIYRPDGKVIAYPELGVRFLLRRLQVVAIEHRAPDGGAAFLARSLRLLAP